MNSKNKILILGSSGQIGSSLHEYILSKGDSVITFDIKDSIEEDLRIFNSKLLQEKVLSSDFVYFLAYDVGGSRYLTKYQHTFEFLHNNSLIMSNVFKILKETKKPFIFASSQMSKMVSSPYGIQKLLGEKISYSLNGRVVRFWNVYGKERDVDKFHVISDFIRMALYDGEIRMITDGSEKRQFLYSKDSSRALYALFENKDIKCNNYCISSYKWKSIYEIAKIIINFIDKDIKIIKGKKKDQTHAGFYEEPDNKIKEIWEPSFSIEEGIREMIEFEKERRF